MNKHKLLEDIRGECECEGCSYCPLEPLVMNADTRILEQYKLVEIYKLHQSEKLGYDIGRETAWLLWAESGLAKKFAGIYNSDLNHIELAVKLGLPTE